MQVMQSVYFLSQLRRYGWQLVILMLLASLLWPGRVVARQFDIQPYLRAVQPSVNKELESAKPTVNPKAETQLKSAAAPVRVLPVLTDAPRISQPEGAAIAPISGEQSAGYQARSSQLALQKPALKTSLADSSTPSANRSVDVALADELVAEGDQLIISVFGQPDLSADLIVGESGVITLPLVGTLEVKTKTAAQIAAAVTQQLEQGQYLRNPKVSVKLIQQQSRSFSVLGEVLRPGRYPLTASLSVLDGLSLAGGMSAKADKQVRLLRRSGKQPDSELIEYAAVKLELDNGAVPEQLAQKLRPNDIIFVAQQKNFYIYGEVRKPGMYPIEEDLNIMRVLSIGGGVTERGSARRIVIHRKMGDGKLREIPAQITDKVEAGDVVYVNERIF